MKYFLTSIFCLFLITNAFGLEARHQLNIDKALLQKLAPLTSSLEVEKLIGPPAACVPVGKQSDEIAICQWKGDVDSNSVFNTLNITFELNQIGFVRAITAKGDYYSIKNGKVVKED